MGGGSRCCRAAVVPVTGCVLGLSCFAAVCDLAVPPFHLVDDGPVQIYRIRRLETKPCTSDVDMHLLLARIEDYI